MSPPYGWRISPHRSLSRDDHAEVQGERPPLPFRVAIVSVRLDQLLHRRGLRPAQQAAGPMVLVAVRIGTAWLVTAAFVRRRGAPRRPGSGSPIPEPVGPCPRPGAAGARPSVVFPPSA